MVSRRHALSAAAGATGALISGQAAQAQTLTSVSPPISQTTSEFIYFDNPAEEFRAQFRIEDNLIKLDSVRSAPPDWPATRIENSCSWVDMDLYANETITSLPVHSCGHSPSNIILG
jgi:hypothetical protein